MSAQRKRRLLIVDDEADLVEMLTLRLVASGRFEVDQAPDGEAGLAKIRGGMPDVVLLDSVMPKLDGWEVCRRLRADPGTRQAKIVMMTAGTPSRAKEEACQAGADRLILKPYEFEELVAMIDSLEAL